MSQKNDTFRVLVPGTGDLNRERPLATGSGFDHWKGREEALNRRRRGKWPSALQFDNRHQHMLHTA